MNTTFLDQKNYLQKYKEQAGVDRKTYWKKFLNLLVTLFLGIVVVFFISMVLFGDSFVGNLLVQLVSFFITLFSIKFILNLLDEKTLDYKEIVKSFTLKQFLYGLLAYILATVLISLGFILLIVPGIIISFMFILVTPIIADKRLKPLAILRESHRLTKRYKMKIFKTILFVGIYYMLIPIFIILIGILMITLGLPIWILFILGIPYILSILWANFALITLLPRIYRDLQKIKSSDIGNPLEKREKIDVA